METEKFNKEEEMWGRVREKEARCANINIFEAQVSAKEKRKERRMPNEYEGAAREWER